MRKILFKLICFLTIGMLSLSACNMPGATTEAPPTETFTPTTEASSTPDVAATQTYEAGLLPTDTPTITSTVTRTPTATVTATPEPPVAEVIRETNCRVGPAGNYDLVATYQPGQKLDVIAKDLGNGFWFVRNVDKPEEQCYLLGQNIEITGDTAALPKFTPRPSPTLAPNFTISFWKFDVCKGSDFALFKVQNTGDIPFRSFYIRVTDEKVDKKVEQVLTAFDLYVGCVLAKNIAPLDPGGEGYITSPPFTWEATRNKLQVVVQLCTEKGLKGVCATQSLVVDNR